MPFVARRTLYGWSAPFAVLSALTKISASAALPHVRTIVAMLFRWVKSGRVTTRIRRLLARPISSDERTQRLPRMGRGRQAVEAARIRVSPRFPVVSSHRNHLPASALAAAMLPPAFWTCAAPHTVIAVRPVIACRCTLESPPPRMRSTRARRLDWRRELQSAAAVRS